MNIQMLMDKIVAKGKTKEMIDAIVALTPKMPNAQRDEFLREMECIAYTYTADEAKHVVQKMTPYGEHWSMDKIKAYLADKKIQHGQCLHYYLVMNMMYNDYWLTAEAFGQKENPDFYFSLAKNFIEDPDGVPFKVEKYFQM